MLALLRDWTYFRYWLAVVVAFLGDSITRMAVIYLVAKLTGDPFMIGLVIFAQLLPSAVLGTFLGPLADRYSRRLLLVGSDLFRPVYFWCVLVGLGNGLYNVPLSSTFMQLSPSHLLGRGIALFTAIFNACYMLGVLFGGWLAGSTGIVITAVYAGLMLVATAIIFPWFRSYQGLRQVGTHEELQAS